MKLKFNDQYGRFDTKFWISCCEDRPMSFYSSPGCCQSETLRL